MEEESLAAFARNFPKAKGEQEEGVVQESCHLRREAHWRR